MLINNGKDRIGLDDTYNMISMSYPTLKEKQLADIQKVKDVLSQANTEINVTNSELNVTDEQLSNIKNKISDMISVIRDRKEKSRFTEKSSR